mmetsp:Transcript_89359/g.157702  ORF Transcript_89359/g.157702 Transcript_89359/m.157702 type:complete len:296 (-) Transcript_89359:145-1032(-)
MPYLALRVRQASQFHCWKILEMSVRSRPASLEVFDESVLQLVKALLLLLRGANQALAHAGVFFLGGHYDAGEAAVDGIRESGLETAIQVHILRSCPSNGHGIIRILKYWRHVVCGVGATLDCVLALDGCQLVLEVHITIYAGELGISILLDIDQTRDSTIYSIARRPEAENKSTASRERDRTTHRTQDQHAHADQLELLHGHLAGRDFCLEVMHVIVVIWAIYDPHLAVLIVLVQVTCFRVERPQRAGMNQQQRYQHDHGNGSCEPNSLGARTQDQHQREEANPENRGTCYFAMP